MVAEKEETKTHSESFHRSIKECSTSWRDNFQPRHNKCADKPACSVSKRWIKSQTKIFEKIKHGGDLMKKRDKGQ